MPSGERLRRNNTPRLERSSGSPLAQEIQSSLRNISIGERTLADYLTQPRLRLLSLAPTDHLRAIIEKTEPLFQRGQNQVTPAHAVIGLLRASLTDSTHTSSSMDLQLPAMLKPFEGELDRFWLTLSEQSDTAPTASFSLTVSAQHKKATGRFTALRAVAADEPATHSGAAVDAILRLASDYQRDVDRASEKHEVTAWRHFRYVKPGRDFFVTPWPIPKWMTLWPWETLNQQWNAALRDIAQITESSTGVSTDSLAASLLNCIHGICRFSTFSQQLKAMNETDAATSIIALLESISAFTATSPDNARQRGISEWVHWTLLYATPEAGLSRTSCSAIITWWKTRFPKESTPKKARDLRLKYHEMTRPNIGAHKFLSAVNKQFKYHPWIDLAEPG